MWIMQSVSCAACTICHHCAILSCMTALTEQEKTEARTRQKKRYRDEAAAKQYAEREHIRSEIPTRKLMFDVMRIADRLDAGFEIILSPTGETIRRELDATRQNGLRMSADIRLKLISKTVPDLKHIELRADVTEEALPQVVKFEVVRPYDDIEAAAAS